MAKVYKAPVDAPDFDKFFSGGRFDNAAYNQVGTEYYETLSSMARENGSSPLLGEIIRFQRGDGYAEYMVWRNQPLELIWLEMGDAWSVEDALIRGLRVSDIKEHVKREQAIKQLFS